MAESQVLFLGLVLKDVFFILKHLKAPVQYQDLRVITDVYNLVKYSNIASIFQLFEFIYYLTTEFLLSYSISNL